LTLVALQDELVDALDHFPGGSVTKTENVLTHTLTEGTQDDAYGLTEITVPRFKSLLVGQDLSLRGRYVLLNSLVSSLNKSRR